MTTRATARWKPLAILGGVFLLGGAAGAAATRAYMLTTFRASLEDASDKGRVHFRLEALTRALDLTEEQQQRIEPILIEAESERGGAVGPCKPALDAARKRTKERLDEVFTPEQRQKHDAYLERRQKRGG
jgi:Spy/CpxP family protein refolding chaperone